MRREDLPTGLLRRCQECIHGGQNIFPDCLDFNPIVECYYFDDINDDDYLSDDYDCGAYMHANTHEELRHIMKNGRL